MGGHSRIPPTNTGHRRGGVAVRRRVRDRQDPVHRQRLGCRQHRDPTGWRRDTGDVAHTTRIDGTPTRRGGRIIRCCPHKPLGQGIVTRTDQLVARAHFQHSRQPRRGRDRVLGSESCVDASAPRPRGHGRRGYGQRCDCGTCCSCAASYRPTRTERVSRPTSSDLRLLTRTRGSGTASRSRPWDRHRGLRSSLSSRPSGSRW